MSTHPPMPPVGSVVEVTFTGTVEETIADVVTPSITFEDTTAYMSWDPSHPPQIKVVDPGWKVGDVAWYTPPGGLGRRTVMYGYSESRDQLPHWRDSQGTIIRIADGTENRIEIIARSTTK